MNLPLLLARLAPGDLVTGMVLGILCQTTAVILLAGLLSRLALRRDAAARHGLWLGTLAWVLLCPALALLAERAGLASRKLPLPFPRPEAAGSSRPDGTGIEVLAFETADGAPSAVPIPVASGHPRLRGRVASDASAAAGDAAQPSRVAAPPAVRRSDVFSGGLVALWASGTLIGLGRIAMGIRRLNALARESRPLDPSRHGTALALARDALGDAPLPPVATSRRVAGPVAIGLIRPRIVLPEGLAEALPAEALRDVLVHEAAHVRRRDPWVGLLQRLAGALHWPNPAVPYLNAQLSRAREEVCDNHVLRRGDACGYARTLLALTELCRPAGASPAGLGLLGARWTLSDRVAGLLDPGRSAMTRSTVRMKLAVTIVLVAMGTLLASVRFVGPALADEPAKQEAARTAAPAVAVMQGDDTSRITGVVVDEQGRPVAGAVVRTFRDSFPETPQASATTAADGTFTLTVAGRHRRTSGFMAEADGGARSTLLRFNARPGESHEARSLGVVRVVLKPSRAVTVRVKDAAGAPVPGAVVEAVDPFAAEPHATTGPDGSAILRLPAEAQVRWVFGRKSGVGSDYFENYSRWPSSEFPPLPDSVSLTLDGAETVRVRAIDSKGAPVSGVVITPGALTKPGKIHYAFWGRPNIYMAASVTTDGEGVATFDWIPKGTRRTDFFIHSATHSCVRSPIYEGTGPAELTARMLRNTPLSGTVRFPDGRPARGVPVAASGQNRTSDGTVGSTNTGADGTYALELAPDQAYMVVARTEEWVGPAQVGVVLREGQPRGGIDFTLIRGTLLHGRVTEGPEGKPVSGAPMVLVQNGGPIPKELNGLALTGTDGSGTMSTLTGTPTDSEGRYQFRVAPGHYVIRGPRFGGFRAMTIEVKDENEIVRDIVLKSPAEMRTVGGVVVEKTADGERPVPRARVWALPVGMVVSGEELVADAQGRFRNVHAPQVNVVLYAVGDGGELAGFTPVLEKADDVKVIVDRASRLVGRLVDADGKPLPKQWVRLQLACGRFYGNSGHYSIALQADQEGRFTFRGLPVGSEGEVAYAYEKDRRPTGVRTVARFSVRDTNPVEVPDLIVLADAPAAGK